MGKKPEFPMHPGKYVVRLPHRGMGNRLIIESRPFCISARRDEEQTRQDANNWRDFIQDEYPKCHVFVIDVKEETDDQVATTS